MGRMNALPKQASSRIKIRHDPPWLSHPLPTFRKHSMTPNDANGHLPTAERPFRVLIISGSDRRQYNCPGVDSKSRMLMLRMADRLPQEWEIDVEDLGNVFAR